jgi:hypothetical protein
MNRFLFFQKWLFIYSLIIMLIGLLIIIFKDTIVFRIINDYINNSFWHVSKVEQSTVNFQSLCYGILGGITAVSGFFMTVISTIPFKKKEKWAWICYFWGITIWLILTNYASIVHGVYVHSIVNLILYLFGLIPLILTKKYFGMDNKKYNVHGIISIVLIFISFGIGIASIAIYSVIVSLINLLTIFLAFVTISIVYCSKCKCRDNCNHLIIGKISILFSKFNPDKYKNKDLILGVMIPMLIAIGLPQYWLINNPTLLFLYWGFIVLAGLEVYFFVCNNCLNDKCSMCRKKQK